MNRYRPGRRMVVGREQRSLAARLTPAIAVLLAVALAVTLLLAIPALRQKQTTHTYYVNRMLNECDTAQREVRTLSRTSSSSSTATLARIRSEVYAMSLISQAEQTLSGRPLVSEQVFTDILNTIEQYFNTLMLSGTNTANLQSELAGELSTLGELVDALE